MSDSKSSEQFIMSSNYLEDLKRDLLAIVCSQTHDQLVLYQRGRYWKTAKAIKSVKNTKSICLTENNEPQLPAEILDDIKLDKDLDVLKNVYKRSCEILTENIWNTDNPYGDLLKVIEVQKRNNNEVDILSNELQDNKSTLRNLENQLEKERTEFTEKISQKTQRIKVLREQLDTMKRINRLEVRLVEKWEENRLSQATIVGEVRERQLMQEILALHRRTADEQRIFYEIESFRNNESSELKAKIAHWEQKFKMEKNKIINQNLTLTQGIADVAKCYAKHREITEQRKHFVAEYLQQKAEELRLYEEQRYRIECAIRIQAWWRGVMVRRCLGPYRKKSKKGKKSKGKK